MDPSSHYARRIRELYLCKPNEAIKGPHLRPLAPSFLLSCSPFGPVFHIIMSVVVLPSLPHCHQPVGDATPSVEIFPLLRTGDRSIFLELFVQLIKSMYLVRYFVLHVVDCNGD